MMTPEEEKQFEQIYAQAFEVLERKGQVTGHRHLNLVTCLDASGEFVRAWALVTAYGGFFDLVNYDAVKSWLEIKGYAPYFEGQVEVTSFDDGVAFCEIAMYAIPNEVWRSSRIITVGEDVSK